MVTYKAHVQSGIRTSFRDNPVLQVIAKTEENRRREVLTKLVAQIQNYKGLQFGKEEEVWVSKHVRTEYGFSEAKAGLEHKIRYLRIKRVLHDNLRIAGRMDLWEQTKDKTWNDALWSLCGKEHVEAYSEVAADVTYMLNTNCQCQGCESCKLSESCTFTKGLSSIGIVL